MRKLILLLIAFPSIAFAADKTSYVIAGCPNNGNGTANSCAGSPGGAGAWNTCAAMVTGEVAANADLTATGMNGNLIVNFSNTGGAKDTTPCNINGFTTDTTHLIDLRGNWTGGVYSTSYYMLEASFNGAPALGVLTVSDADIKINKFQVINTATSTGGYSAIQAASGAVRGQVTNSLIATGACDLGGGGFCVGLWWDPNVANCKIIAANNVSYVIPGVRSASSSNFAVDCGGSGNAGQTVVLLNNTADRGNTGFQGNSSGASDTLDMENNITQNNATTGYDVDLSSGTFTSATRNTNLSMDTTSPNNTWDSKTVSFTAVGSDYHMAAGEPASTGARDSGTDLSANTNYAFSTDWEGTTRPVDSAWDMGADEGTSIATPTPTPTAVARKGMRCSLSSKGQCGINF